MYTYISLFSLLSSLLFAFRDDFVFYSLHYALSLTLIVSIWLSSCRLICL